MKRRLAIACLVICACGRTPHSIAVDVRAATIPAGQGTPGFSEQRRDGMTMRYAWQIPEPADWNEYTGHLSAELERKGFRRTSGPGMVFVRSEAAERDELNVTRDNARVLVKLAITPE